MLINMDKNKIVELLMDFNAVTGLRIGLFGLDRQEIASYPTAFSEFCSLVKGNEQGNLYCRRCDTEAFDECERIKSLYIYKCKIGLTEALLPILYDDVIIAFLMFGQVFDGQKNKKEFQKVVGFMDNINCERLKAAFFALQEMSHDKIEAIAKMMGVYAAYIRFSDLIYIYIGGDAHFIKSYIEQNIDKKLSLETISKSLNMGKTSICLKFKESFNMTINQYITKTRLEKAKQLLRNSSNSSTLISEKCGYLDYNYFIRIFKKNIGQTPLDYRKTLNNYII